MYFTIALLNGILTTRVRKQEKMTRVREERTNALYQLTRELSLTTGIDQVIKIALQNINKYFSFDCVFMLQERNNELSGHIRHETQIKLSEAEMSIAAWVNQHGRKAGKFTDTLPSTEFTFFPMNGNKLRIGVVAIKSPKGFTGEEEIFWETYKVQISNALEREFLNDFARRALILDESDKLYKTLFNSISHELRIPVATIMGASETLISKDFDKQTTSLLYDEIYKASDRLNRLIENLLNMSRLETGRITPHLDWHDVRDLVNKVLENLRSEIQNFNVDVVIAENMPLVKIDFGLMQQVLHNLVLNATQYSRPNTTLRIKMYYDRPNFIMKIMDRGPGFPENTIPLVFNKFYRVSGTQSVGTGLGLSIVKGFVDAHNGSVNIENRRNGGAQITVKIPTETPDFTLIDKNTADDK
jgi:two-component system sensor histidine kinase KdpD